MAPKGQSRCATQCVTSTLSPKQTTPNQPADLRPALGGTRALILEILKDPGTTTDLADKLGVTAAAVSQNLKILREARLVSARRHGRHVFYQQTPLASTLVNAMPFHT